jgi:hypothetical protein
MTDSLTERPNKLTKHEKTDSIKNKRLAENLNKLNERPNNKFTER